MSPAKVTLSPKELELVNNADWILTKNAVISKVYELFGQLNETYNRAFESYKTTLTPETGFLSPKISKGEQYGGLPWVMLDNPRYFTNEDTFSIRSFFWWGKFCSITLQLSGKSQQKYSEVLQKYLDSSAESGWYIGVGDDQWQHHFEEKNYQPVEKIKGLAFAKLPFIKLAKKIPLTDWDQLPVFFEDTYGELLRMLAGG